MYRVEGIPIRIHLWARNIKLVCHATPCQNLPSIFESGGIHPFAERQRRGIAEAPSPHNWGRLKKVELAAYVICAFKAPRWMANAHDEDMAIILLDAGNVCARRGVCFCPINTASARVTAERIELMTGCEAMDRCLGPRGDVFMENGAEILVPGSVPTRDFRSILVFDEETRQRWQPALTAAIPQYGEARPPRRATTLKLRHSRQFAFPKGYTARRRS